MPIDRAARWAIIVLGVIAVIAALRAAADLLAPLALALVLGVVLSPVATRLERLGIGALASAGSVVVASLAILGGLLLFLGPYLTQLWTEAPMIWRELRESFVDLQRLIRGISEASEEVARAIDPDAAPQSDGGEGSPPVISITDAVLAAPAFAAQLMVFLGTLFFFSLTRSQTYRWIARVVSGPDSTIAQRLEEADSLVSRYFLTISLINLGMGAAVAIALWALGLPSAILWGVLAGLLNFVLYLGPALVAVGLLVAGVVVFDGLAALAPLAVYLVLNVIESQVVTPLLVGRHLRVNPLLVFLSLVLWLWIWGPIGGIVAIPLAIWTLALAGQMGGLDEYPALARDRAREA